MTPTPYVWLDPADAVFVSSCRDALKIERRAYEAADAERRALRAENINLRREIAALSEEPAMTEKKHTKDILAGELAKAGLFDMAARASHGYYHDFLSPLAFPCQQLAADLEAAGTPAALALRARHLNGEFDASPEESEEWARGPEGQAAIASLAGGR